jgi:Rps23 Pro-64 3,4-dihydroxylase Tpa1-like proline 4-hydroxylase
MTTVPDADLDFSPFEVFSGPFPYAITKRTFIGEISYAILEWLQTKAPWQLVETDFYEQFEFSLFDADLPPCIRFLGDRTFIDVLSAEIEKLFGVRLAERVDVTAHRLIQGQRIRIHNDYIFGGETHRLLIQLNHGWRDEDGGFLLFFNSPDPSDIHKVFRPVHNTAIAFAISSDSNHAVTTIHGNERFTLVYSFYQRNHA